jgi:murein DD-endopeptidase MepM/ murein hydrolase activator NlpD
MFISVLSLFFLFATSAFAQSSGLQGGAVELGPLHDSHHAAIDTAYRRALARSRAMGLTPVPRALPSPIIGFPLRLRPVSKALRGDSNYFFVDQGNARDFSCMSRSYSGHQGTDFVLFPFWWTMMENEEVEVVAAAPGTILDKQDGSSDRLCNGPGLGNYVFIQQDDGAVAMYLHMKNGSITGQQRGSRVATGDYLGLVGASGPSTGVPHLHFELRSGGIQGPTIDPFAGQCGDRRTSWRHQAENPTHTELLRVATHTSKPTPETDRCSPGVAPNYSDRFASGDKVWIAAYLRDQRPDTAVNIKILRPDGTLYREWDGPPPQSLLPLSYWYTSFDLPARRATGRWTARVTFDAKVAEHVFNVGPSTGVTKVISSVTPLAATATRRSPAVFRVTVRNHGSNTAVGCTLAPDAPVAATWEFKPVGAGPGDPVNVAFDIRAGGKKLLDLSIRPKSGATATQYEVPIRAVCNNAPATASDERVNIVKLSF